jgi:uncharacterized C2H2 Zn-finger protein
MKTEESEEEMWNKAHRVAIAATFLRETWIFKCPMCGIVHYSQDYEEAVERGEQHIMAHLLMGDTKCKSRKRRKRQ